MHCPDSHSGIKDWLPSFWEVCWKENRPPTLSSLQVSLHVKSDLTKDVPLQGHLHQHRLVRALRLLFPFACPSIPLHSQGSSERSSCIQSWGSRSSRLYRPLTFSFVLLSPRLLQIHLIPSAFLAKLSVSEPPSWEPSLLQKWKLHILKTGSFLQFQSLFGSLNF